MLKFPVLRILLISQNENSWPPASFFISGSSEREIKIVSSSHTFLKKIMSLPVKAKLFEIFHLPTRY